MYHNLYAINNVVTALVAMESERLVIVREIIRGFLVKAMGPMGVNVHEQQVTAVPGRVKGQHKETTSRQTSIHPRL